MAQRVSVKLKSANDEWEFRLACRVNTIALYNCQLDPLPWERLVLPLGALPDTPVYARIPEGMLSDAKAARGAGTQILTEKGAVTLHQMIGVTNSKADALRAIDRSFECEISMLNSNVEDMVKSSLQTKLLDCLPSRSRACLCRKPSSRCGT